MKRFLALISFLSLLVFSSVPALAQGPSDNANSQAGGIPEKNGDYPDSEHPGVRVRVFVHEPKTSSAAITGCTDPTTGPTDGITGWHLPSSVTYNLNTSSAPAGVGSNLVTLADLAFNTWHNAIPTKVSFNRGADTTVVRNALDYKNIVAWGRASGSALAVTYTRYYTANHQVADVDTIFNKKFVWSWTPYALNLCGLANTYDAQDILTHELGHWMGLNDQYSGSYGNNTMYGYGSKGEIKKDTLTSGDFIPLGNIYP